MADRDDDIKAIKQLAAAWRTGWITGDADLLLSLYADEPVVMPQGRQAITGKHAVRPLYEAVFRELSITSETTLMEVEVSGDWGYFWSTYRLTATPKAGGVSTESEGKSLFIVKREKGAWKIARLMDNSSR